MRRVDLICPSSGTHVLQLYTGFAMLADQGALEVRLHRAPGYDPGMEGSILRARIDDRKVVYDTRDHASCPPEDLAWATHYFKRSFDRVAVEATGRAEVIRPLGLNYPTFAHGDWGGRRLLWTLRGLRPGNIREVAAQVRRLTPIISRSEAVGRSATPVHAFEQSPDEVGGSVLLLTRVWDPDRATGARREMRMEMNRTRTESIQLLREHLGPSFIGGLVPMDEHTRRTYPDLVVDPSLTEKRAYLNTMRSAASRPILNESMHHQVPGTFAEGANYLSYSAPDQILNAVHRLLEGDDARAAMRLANHEYYLSHVRPDGLVARTLEQLGWEPEPIDRRYPLGVPTEPLRVWAGPLAEMDISDPVFRLALTPIMRARLDDRHDEAARNERYGSLLTSFQLTGPGDADVALLPRLVERSDPGELEEMLRRAEAHDLRTLVFSGHDLEPVMPSDSVILLHPGPTRGAQPRADALAIPYVFTDRAHVAPPRPKGDRPSVAFCGQGASRPTAAIGQTLDRVLRAMVSRRRTRVVHPSVRGHIGLRAAALEALERDVRVEDRFIIRDRYRAGAITAEERATTQREFDDNLRSASYALCVRGTGNFSARFYEALSFGRVPVFVDTDCILPFDNEIDWRARTVWVPSSEVAAIADRLVDQHPAVQEDPRRSAEALRTLWEERLTQDGFFRHLPDAVRRLL